MIKEFTFRFLLKLYSGSVTKYTSKSVPFINVVGRKNIYYQNKIKEKTECLNLKTYL